MPVSRGISGLGFCASGERGFSKPSTDSESRFSDSPIQDQLHFPINWSFRTFKATERAQHNSIGDPQDMLHKQLPDCYWLSQNLMYSKKGVVYKLHAGRFINHTPGESRNCGLFIQFRGLLRRNPTGRGESLKQKRNPGTLIICRKWGASGQEKYNTSSIYIAILSANCIFIRVGGFW